MEMVKVCDIDMRCERRGQGPPLVMIMGFTANIDWWPDEFTSVLEKEFELLMFDNRGAGRTTTGTAPFTMRQFAKDTAALMCECGITRAHVLGASMGGMIAQQFAIEFPWMVDRLVLACTLPGLPRTKLPSPAIFKTLRDQGDTAEENARRSLGLLFPQAFIDANPDLMETVVERISKEPISERNARRQMGAIMRFHASGRLPGVRSETLVMCGEEDVLIPPENSRRIASRIPRAKLVTFPASGHGFLNQCAEEAGRAVADFLAVG
jgi:pimeloyl-ACP methyl ester carboxylesterase